MTGHGNSDPDTLPHHHRLPVDPDRLAAWTADVDRAREAYHKRAEQIAERERKEAKA